MIKLAEKLKEEIIEKRQKYLESKIKRTPQTNFRASDIHECDRYLSYSILKWQDRLLYDAGLQAVFDRGNKEEAEVVKDLMDLGYQFIQQQTPFEIKNREGDVFLRGSIDGKILYQDKAIPCEIKSMNMNTFGSLNSIEDFNKRPLHRKYLRQMQMYLYGNNEEAGLFILSDLQGHFKIFIVELDYQECENILSRLEALWPKIKAKEISKGIEFDDKICGYCPFRQICNTKVIHEGANFVDDDELESMLERREELKTSIDEYKELDTGIKARFSGSESDIYVGSNWHISSKSYKRSIYDVPKDVKEQYKEIKEYFRVNISRLK